MSLCERKLMFPLLTLAVELARCGSHASAFRFGPMVSEDGDTESLTKGVVLPVENRWNEVQDFGWLKQAASPNW